MDELSSSIVEHVDNINKYLEANRLPAPSFDPDCPQNLLRDSAISASRQAILDATDELHALALGPAGILTNDSVGPYRVRTSP